MSQNIKQLIKKPIYAMERAWLARSKDKPRRPDFIHIGSGQAGTTWMFKNLQSHPGVFVCHKKEAHYFTRAFHEWSFSYYCSLFDEGGDRVSGELTPAYFLLTPKRIAEVRKLVPDTRLVMTVRNPVDRSWSGARRAVTQRAEKQGKTLDQMPESEFFNFFDNEHEYWGFEHGGAADVTMTQAHYSRAIDNWLSIFPEEQLKITFFDDIKARPQELMKDVCRHINAPTDIDWAEMPLSKVVNKNPPKPMPEKYREYLTEMYRDEIAELKHRFGDAVSHWQ